MAFKHNSQTAAGEPAWSDVDQSALPPEAFVAGKDFPHHYVKDGRLLLHRGRLSAARVSFSAIGSDDPLRGDIKEHLAAHPDAETLRKRAALSMLDFVPPVGVRYAMTRGLALHAAGHAGPGLRASTVKRAKRFVHGVPSSQTHIQRAAKWFSSHAHFSAASPESPAGVAWLLWGGRAGGKWAARQAGAIKTTLSSQTPSAYMLSADPDTFIPEGAAIQDGDTPLRRMFRKELIREGLYIHPGTGQVIPVTRDRMQHWVTNHKRRTAKGIDTEFVVDHSDGARDVMGYIKGLELVEATDDDPCRLFGLHEVRGEDAIASVGRCRNTSLGIENFTDSDGEEYGETIVHNSLCQRPVVPGQSDFEPVSLSSGQDASGDESTVPVYRKPVHSEAHMEFLEGLQEALGADGDEFTEAIALSMVGKNVKDNGDLAEQVEALQAAATDPAKTAEPEPVKLSAIEADPELLAELQSSAGDRLDLLVEKGKITPATRDGLATLCEQAPIMLSAKVGEEGKRSSVMRQVLTLLDGNDVVALSAQTGVQELGRKDPDKDAHEHDTEGDKKRAEKIKGAIR